ncbi:hypothetical protein FKM82_028520 [Ascaphus truei]
MPRLYPTLHIFDPVDWKARHLRNYFVHPFPPTVSQLMFSRYSQVAEQYGIARFNVSMFYFVIIAPFVPGIQFFGGSLDLPIGFL